MKVSRSTISKCQREYHLQIGHIPSGPVLAKWMRRRLIKVWYKDRLGRKWYYTGDSGYSMDVTNAAGIYPTEKDSIFLSISAQKMTPEIEYYVDNPKKI